MGFSYSKKTIRVTITLSTGNQFVFEGYAINATINKTGGVEFAQANVEIFGLSIDTMAALTWIQFKPNGRPWNALSIEAGEAGTALSTVFLGEIQHCYADLNGAKPVLKIQALTGSYPVLIPQSPTAVNGQQKVADFCEAVCKEIGYKFKNAGVETQISDCVINGDPITKIRAVANAAGADTVIEDGQITIVPRGKTVPAEGSIPVISAETGMIGYPTFTTKGIQAQTYFLPTLHMASAVQIKSIVPSASGVWKITQLTHELSANNPSNGVWRTSFQAMWISDD